MNNSMMFEEQTEQIVEALFNTLCVKKQGLKVTNRCLQLHSGIEVHKQVDSASNFNPHGIAMSLQSIGDQYNAEIEDQVQAIIAEESTRKIQKFEEVAESLSRIWIAQNPGLEQGRAFLAVAVKLFKKIITTHGDSSQINILTETINRNPEVRGYVERQGGWGNLQ